jgi:ClpP class serine protease
MSENLLNIPGGVNVPYLDQWLGSWFVEPERAAALFGALRQLNIGVHLQQRAAAAPATPAAVPVDVVEPPRTRNAYGYRVIDGVAILELNGALMKHEASAMESTSTVMMRRSVRNLMVDERVKAVIFQIDSPGGTVAGAYELAADIRTLAKIKPVHAHAANLCASAAYLMAAQMTSISAYPSTLVGSLGTFGVVYDTSQAAAMEGVKVHLLKGKINGKTAMMKGAGTPGTQISPEQLERMEESVNDLNQHFYQAVLDGPRKPNAAAVEGWFIDAGVWIAGKARGLGLIDRVESFDDMLSRVAQQDEHGRNSAVPSESTKPTDDSTSTRRRGASIAELRAACPGANADFLVDCASKEMTAAQAADAFRLWQQKQLSDGVAAETPPRVRKPGVPPSCYEAGDEPPDAAATIPAEDAVALFNAAVALQMEEPGYGDRRKAVAAVCRAYPRLHEAYLTASNLGAGQRKEIADRFRE